MYKIGEVISVEIVGIRTYGLFVVNEGGRKGLIHVSECSDGFIKNLWHVFVIGQNVQAVVMDDDGDQKFSLSIRALIETKGNLQGVPKPVTAYVGKKKYWTKANYNSGVTPVLNLLHQWKREKEKEFHEKA